MDNSAEFDPSIICFLNRPLGEKVLIDLLERSDLKVGLVVLHEESNRDFGALSESLAVTAVTWQEFTSDWFPAHGRDGMFSHGLSVLFGHRLPVKVLGLAQKGVLNFHPSFLPFGRGAHPAAWAIWSDEPYGATLHLMEETLDTGPVLNQVSIPIHETDTSHTLYEKGLDALWDLYLESALPWLRGHGNHFHPQEGVGSSHSVSDLEILSGLELTSSIQIGRTIKLLRARTFGAHDGARYRMNGEQYGITVRIHRLDDLAE